MPEKRIFLFYDMMQETRGLVRQLWKTKEFHVKKDIPNDSFRIMCTPIPLEELARLLSQTIVSKGEIEEKYNRILATVSVPGSKSEYLVAPDCFEIMQDAQRHYRIVQCTANHNPVWEIQKAWKHMKGMKPLILYCPKERARELEIV